MKLGALIWIILGTTLAGAIVVAILSMPQYADQAAKLIPLGSLAGFVLAIPLSIMISRNIQSATKR